MTRTPEQHAADLAHVDELITRQAGLLANKLQALARRHFAPNAEKSLRPFQPSEVAKFLGIGAGYLKNLSLEGKGPQPAVTPTKRRSYTAAQIRELRQYLDETGRPSRRYLPWRAPEEHLQVLAIVNFKGGSCKTTTAAHLSQYLALRGYRVLAIDLDPQASLSALFGVQPELNVKPNESLYGAIRYDSDMRPLSTIIRGTNFPGLDLVPANLELMEFEYETPRLLATQEGRVASQVFFSRLDDALSSVRDDYDVVVLDCPPQLGYLTMAALCTATSVLITVHPQMLDVLSMCQFLTMLGDVLGTLTNAGVALNYNWLRYVFTRVEPGDSPQAQMVAFMRELYGPYILGQAMVKSVAISDAGMTKQTLYEVDRRQFAPATYDRAMQSLDAVNGEIEDLINAAWRREDKLAAANFTSSDEVEVLNRDVA